MPPVNLSIENNARPFYGEPIDTVTAAEPLDCTELTADQILAAAIENDDAMRRSRGSKPINVLPNEGNPYGDYPVLTAYEESLLGKKLIAGRVVRERNQADGRVYSESEKAILDEEAAAKRVFLLTNIKLVVAVSRKYPETATIDSDDLAMAGVISVMERAIENFDHRKGFKFSTYAMFWLRQSMSRERAAHADPIPVPENITQRVNSKLARGVPLNATDQAAVAVKGTRSLNAPIGFDGKREVVDVVPDRRVDVEAEAIDAADRVQAIDLVASALQQLRASGDVGARYARILEMRSDGSQDDDATYAQIGNEFGMSGQWARVNYMRALEASRKIIKSMGFEASCNDS